MNSIAVDQYTYEIPGKWDELSAKQLERLCGVLITYHSLGDTTTAEWRTIREECLKILLGWNRPWFFLSKRQKALLKLPAEHRVSLLNHPELLPWIFEKATISQYIISQIRVIKKDYIGPHDHMLNVTVEDMIACHISAQLYELTQEHKYLIELIANLYRPLDPEYKLRSTSEAVADRREPNSLFAQEERERLFTQHLTPALCMAIYLQYCSHLEDFTGRYPLFFSKVEASVKEDKEMPDLQSYFLLVKNLSGGKFGNYASTKRESSDIFFCEVEDNIQANLDAKSKK